ncbi:MAG: glycosyltransferase [Candidatus Babeliales bacterium]
MINTYCFVAAKSAGHILPALALARQTKQANPNAEIIFISTNTLLDQKLLNRNQDITRHIPFMLPNIPYYKPWRLPIFLWQLIKCTYQNYMLLKSIRPKSIVSTGGLIALPTCLAGWWLNIPIDLYELNAEPGMAINWLSKLATHVYYCFDETAHALPAKKRRKAHYPLYISLNTAAKSYADLNFDKNKKTIFLLGGSQGSEKLNQALKNILSHNKQLAGSVNIIHQIGGHETNLETWRSWYKEHHIPAYLFTYEPTCVPYYKLADVVICRSGAGTLFELEALQKQYITIPLETKSTQHQVTNAVAMERKYPKLVKVVRQKDNTHHAALAKEIQAILESL